MARQAIPNRPAPPDTSKKGLASPLAVPVQKAGADVPDYVKGIVHDITHGTQELVHMTKESAARLRERYNRMKAFVSDR